MPTISLHYWAGAKAVAGVATEDIEACTVRDALEIVSTRRADPQFDQVLRASSLLINGVAAHEEQLARQISQPITVEILPPFAGGG
ncbi:MAG TPA: hypothetical protein VFP89_13535 [Propionibacteriaceae bacterium]|nr:hypothetical protein [Propionibacteriaceae bacterium]